MGGTRREDCTVWRLSHVNGKCRNRSVTEASLARPRTANKAPEARVKQKSLAHGFQRECGLPTAWVLTSNPELWDSFCCFNPASLWHFVTIVLGNSYTTHHPGNTTNWFTSIKAKYHEHIMNGFVYSCLPGYLKKNSHPQKWPWLEKSLALQSARISNSEVNFPKSSCIHSYRQHSVLQLSFQQMDLPMAMTRFLMLFHSFFFFLFLTILGGWHSLLSG